MNGIMFYLRPTTSRSSHGHTIYIDSAVGADLDLPAPVLAALRLRRLGDGNVGGILSVDISDWERPARRTGKVAVECTRRRDQGGGLGAAQGPPQRRRPPCSTTPRRRLVPRPRRSSSQPDAATNLEPLLINTAGSWDDRPDAVTRGRQPLPGLRLRAHPHRPGHDGGRQRGRPPGRQRDPRRRRLDAARCDVWKLARAGASSARARALDRIRWGLRRPRHAAATGDRATAGSSRSGWRGRLIGSSLTPPAGLTGPGCRSQASIDAAWA